MQRMLWDRSYHSPNVPKARATLLGRHHNPSMKHLETRIAHMWDTWLAPSHFLLLVLKTPSRPVPVHTSSLFARDNRTRWRWPSARLTRTDWTTRQPNGFCSVKETNFASHPATPTGLRITARQPKHGLLGRSSDQELWKIEILTSSLLLRFRHHLLPSMDWSFVGVRLVLERRLY